MPERQTTQDQERQRQEAERRIRDLQQGQTGHSNYGKRMREKLKIREEEKVLKK